MEGTQLFYGKMLSVDPEGKYADFIILHYGKSNENRWRPIAGCLASFLERIARAKKNIPACYQHDERQLVGHWENLVSSDDDLRGRLMFDDIPFVREVVLPQLKSGTLQGASPTISAIQDTYNRKDEVWDVIEGVLVEASVVGLPADLKADVLELKASVQAREKENFEIELLTI